MVRIKVTCKDALKIPENRLYEMNKEIFKVSFVVELEGGEEQQGKGNNDGGDGNDKGNDNGPNTLNDDEDDGVEKFPTEEFQPRDPSSSKTPVSCNGNSSRYKAVNTETYLGDLNQESQLMTLMGKSVMDVTAAGDGSQSERVDKLDKDSKIDEILEVQDTMCDLQNTLSISEDGKQASYVSEELTTTPFYMASGIANDSTPMAVDSLVTPKVEHKMDSDCYIVGNKYLSILSDESHHSKWEEFRNLAKEGVSDECSRLLKRMELEDSDEEYDLLDDEMVRDLQENDVSAPAESEPVGTIQD